MRIAVIGDSIMSRKNGAASHCAPELLDSLIKSLGVFDIEVRNYSVPGLTYKTAMIPTPGFTLRNGLSPLDAVRADGCDFLFVVLGVNDRNNPNAANDAALFLDWLPATTPAFIIRQNMFDADGVNDSVVTQDEQARMDAVYGQFNYPGFAVSLGKLYDLGYTYDGLHPTVSGSQWLAAAMYMFIQLNPQLFPGVVLTPITRNIAWLYSQPDAVREQLRVANT